ncbi:hypothetical protein [Staphylococcus cohnii]|uniref:hypothetical protein n=1 Tax=Staphylococcus cohnii TaxID=29382 RepID=UPI003CE9BD51
MNLKQLASDMASYYVEEKLAQRLIETDHEILNDIGDEVLNEEGYPEWVKLADVRYTIHLVTNYTFEDWAELGKAMFDIENVKQFVKEDMYDMFIDFIDLFDIKMYIKTDKEELETAQ